MELVYLTSKVTVTAIYVFALMLLCSFGLHRLYLSVLYKRYRYPDPLPEQHFTDLPAVTVQLPLYNERYVAERLISSVCDLDYPRHLLHIQVLDDSTDNTTAIASGCVNIYRNRGFDIELIHRDERTGFKAGALEKGLETAKGELIAIFDADFLPPQDFLKKTVHYFSDDSVGMVQTRWGHINIDYSLLTKIQSILLDGHFIIEQTTRFRHGVFLNFNGTGGVLRRSCIESSGGWEHDTLTEDLDLSYRAQMNGWRMVYLKDVISNAELPVDMNGFKSQQHRWAKGGIQTAKKLFLKIIRRDDLPLKIKAEAFFHLMGNLSYLLLVTLLTLMLPMGYFWRSIGWETVFITNVIGISAGMLSILYFYVLTVIEAHGNNWRDYVLYVPLTLAVGAGLAINNSKAVLEALTGRISGFVRTPKYAITSGPDIWKVKSYVSTREVTAVIEMSLGILLLLQTVYALLYGFLSWIPFLVMLQFGFLYTSVLSIYHGSGRGIRG